MSQRKIKKPNKNFKKRAQESIANLEGFRDALQKLKDENRVLNGEASDVLEEFFKRIDDLESRVADLEKGRE